MMLNQYIRYAYIAKRLQYIKPKKVLEVGSGSKGISELYPHTFTGIDRSTEDYSGTVRTVPRNMKFVQGDVMDMPFKSNSFDMVFSIDMLEHLPKAKRKKAIHEMIRVSKQYVFVAFPYGKCAHNTDLFLLWLRVLFSKLKLMRRLPWLEEHIRMGFSSQEDILKGLKNENNINITILYNGFCPLRICVMLIDFFTPLTYISGFLVSFLRTTHCDFMTKLPAYRLVLEIEKYDKKSR